MSKLVAIMGKGRSGKDTTGAYLVDRHHFLRVAFADPMKRFCAEVFDFDHDQLHGEKRDAPDLRYVRAANRVGSDPTTEVAVPTYLTPRFALQTLGSEWGRTCYPNVWIEYALRVAKTLLTDRDMDYTPAGGLFTRCTQRPPGAGVVFTDARFRNELEAMKAAGAVAVYITRHDLAPLAGGIAGHASEAEQDGISRTEFDVVLHNDGTIADLHEQIEAKLVPLLK